LTIVMKTQNQAVLHIERIRSLALKLLDVAGSGTKSRDTMLGRAKPQRRKTMTPEITETVSQPVIPLLALPSHCERHPNAMIRHSWDEHHYILNGLPAGEGWKSNHTFECAECGRPLAEPTGRENPNA